MSIVTSLAASLALALLPAALSAGPAPRAALAGEGDRPPEVVRLKVGSEVVGEVVGFDEAKGVKLRRVEDGALLDVGFDQMVPEDARRIRAAEGYLPDEPEPILVDAMRVTLMDGTELLGVIVEQGVETFTLRQGTKSWPLVRARVRSIVPDQVDALEVYPAEELYAQEVARRNLGGALDHYNMALFCESLQLWPRVQEHLAQVTALDPAFKADIVAAKAKRATLRLESGEESSLLAKAHRFAQRDQYDDALAILDDFLAEKPGSGLRSDFEKARALIKRQRDKWIREQTIVHFFSYVGRVARQIATEAGSSAKSARKRMELEGTTMALEATAGWLRVDPKEVQAMWEAEDRNVASPHYANYGSGTFTLGVDLALKGLVKEEETEGGDEAGPGPGNETLEDKIKKLIEQKKKEQEAAQKRAKEGGAKKQEARGPEIADVPPTEEEWWNALGADDRTDYLVAWWADHDPHVKIFKFDGRKCSHCTGIGVLRFFDRNGQDKSVPCPRCKGIQIDRILRFH